MLCTVVCSLDEPKGPSQGCSVWMGLEDENTSLNLRLVGRERDQLRALRPLASADCLQQLARGVKSKSFCPALTPGKM